MTMKPKWPKCAANNTGGGGDDEDAQPKAVNLDEPWAKCKVPNNSPSITEGSGQAHSLTQQPAPRAVIRHAALRSAALSTLRSFSHVYVGLGVVMIDDIGRRGLGCSAIDEDSDKRWTSNA